MFGYVMANGKTLSKEEKKRYGMVYCGICRQLPKGSHHADRSETQDPEGSAAAAPEPCQGGVPPVSEALFLFTDPG